MNSIQTPQHQEIKTFLDAINLPRLTGSEGEHIAQDRIKKFFQKIPQANVSEQPFTTSRTFIDQVLVYYYIMLGVLTILSAGFLLAGINIGTLVVSLILVILSSGHKQIVWRLGLLAPKWGKPIETKNIIATIEPSNSPTQTLVYLAHYDSMSHKLTPVLEELGYIMGYVVGWLFGVYALINAILLLIGRTGWVSPAISILGIGCGLLTFIQLFNQKENLSQGTIDNATGTVQLYHLGIALSKQPLSRTRVILVATGAEELGNYGTLALLQQNPLKLDLKTTKMIIIDSIGVKDSNNIIYGIGLPLRHYSLEMEKVARKLLQDTPTPLKMMTIPPFLNVLGDLVVADLFGYPTIWFTATSFIYHTPKDTMKALDEEKFWKILEFIEEFTHRLDHTH